MDKVDFRYDEGRPWGYLAETIPVFSIDPNALYQDWDDEVPSILRVIATRVSRGFKDEAFLHAREVVEDALNHYVGPYGPVGIAHEKVPFRCGCMDRMSLAKLQNPQAHSNPNGVVHTPCYKFGWVMAQVLVTHDEAQQRLDETIQLDKALVQARREISTWLERSKEGKARLVAEVKRLKNERKARKKHILRALPQLKKNVVIRRADVDVAKEKKALEKAMAGATWTDKEERQATFAIEDIEQDMMRLENQIQAWTAELKTLQQDLKRRKIMAYVPEITDTLLEMAGADIREKVKYGQSCGSVVRMRVQSECRCREEYVTVSLDSNVETRTNRLSIDIYRYVTFYDGLPP